MYDVPGDGDIPLGRRLQLATGVLWLWWRRWHHVS
jgi:hypothetical protein